MDQEIQLIADSDGLALIGDPTTIELFLVSEGLDSKELDLTRFLPKLGTAAAAVEAGAQITANAGRWVQLSEHSAKLVAAGNLMTGSAPGLKRAVITTGQGKITNLIEIVQTPAQFLANPAVLAGVGGLMSQMAMQRAIDEIGEYLAVIDAKVDDILRAQKDAVLADMIAVALVIDEAMTVRAQVGRVSETTWSKVQATSLTIARTQAYALRQLDALAEKLERARGADAAAAAFKATEHTVQEWLVVLARCTQLQDAVGVLELDRVLDASPDELDRHRVGLTTARKNRLEMITRSTTRLLTRMDAVADLSTSEVLMNPFNSRAVVESTNQAGGAVVQFHAVVGVAGDRQALEAKRWLTAVEETRDQVIKTGADGVETAVRIGGDTFDRARKLTGKFAGDLSERLLRQREGDGEDSKDGS
jgi:hypothetical protein